MSPLRGWGCRQRTAFARFGVTHDHGKNWPIADLAAAGARLASRADWKRALIVRSRRE
jgi:hypothetical protein